MSLKKKYKCDSDDHVFRKPVYCEDACLRLKLKTTKPPIGNSGPAYEKHKKNLREMTSSVDNKAPHLDVRVLMKSAKLKADCKRMERIMRDNALLLAAINRIKRTKGTLDTFNPAGGIRFSHMQAAHSEIKFIMKKNLQMRKRLIEAKPYCITREECNVQWRKTLAVMDVMAKHPLLFSSARQKPPCHQKFRACRPRVYFDVRIGNRKNFDRMIFELYGDMCPITVRNFLAICSGSPDCRGLTYSGSFIHRIVQGLYCQGGDITQGNGNGGVSIYGGNFKNENFKMKHDRPGNLAMCSFKGKCNSQFTITFRPLPPLNGKRVVFGHLVSGFKTLEAISRAGRKCGRPMEPVCIIECGQYYTMSNYISSLASMRNKGIERVIGEPYWMKREQDDDDDRKKKRRSKKKKGKEDGQEGGEADEEEGDENEDDNDTDDDKDVEKPQTETIEEVDENENEEENP